MKTKICTKCERRKPITSFSKCTRRKDKVQAWCKACVSTRDKLAYNSSDEVRQRYYATNRRLHRTIQIRTVEYLKAHPCVDCGETDPVVLEFDHVHGKKKFAIGAFRRVSVRWSTISNEIAKCDVVCSNCHKRRTARRGNWFKQF